MFSRLARFLVERPLPVVLALLFSSIVASILAWHTRFDFTLQTLYRGQDDLVNRSEELKQTFGYEDAVLLVLLESVGSDTVLSPAALTWQAEVTGKLKQIPDVNSVDSLATLSVSKVTFSLLPSVQLVPLVQALPVDDEAAAAISERLEQIDLVYGSLLSRDHSLAAVLVECDPESRDLDTMRELVATIKQAVDRQPLPAGFEVRYSGISELRLDIVQHLQAEQMRLIPFAGILYLAALGLAFRRLSGSLIPLLAVGMGLVWTMSMLVVTGQSFNIITNILPVLLMVIGVSNCVHVISRYAEESHTHPRDRKLATQRTIEHMAVACLLTLATTAVGFASFLAARSIVLQSFGLQAMMGLGLLYVSIIATLGVSLRFFRAPRSGRSAQLSRSVLTRTIVLVGRAVTGYPKTTLSVTTLVIAAAIWSASGISINSYTVETYDDDHPTTKTIRTIEQKMSGMFSLEIGLRADGRESFLEPDVYQRIAKLTRFALDHDDIVFARSYVDLIEARSVPSSGALDTPPSVSDEKARHIRRVERFLRRYADDFGYGAFMTSDGKHARILIRVRDAGTRRLMTLIEQIQAEIDILFPPELGIDVQLTGDAYLNTVAMDGMIRGLLASFGWAALVIFGVIALMFRSLRTALISVVPNLTPLCLTLGYMGLRGFDMNAGNVLVFGISLGIAVDDTIHFLYRYREESRLQPDVRTAVLRTLEGTGRAIVLTSLLVVSGLGVLLLSDFVPNRRFAELTSLTMIGALFGDLVLLPASLLLFSKKDAS